MKKLTRERIRDFKTLMIYSSLGLGTATGLVLLVRHFIKKSRANRAEKHSLQEGDPATFAKQLRMAFDNDNSMGWGTDEQAVNRVFSEIPSRKMYDRVQKEYSSLYGRSLNADLQDELSSAEYDNLIRLMNAKK